MTATASARTPRAGTWSARLARPLMVRFAQRIRHGRLRVRFPDGTSMTFGDSAATPIELRIHDDSFFSRVLFGGEIGLGEAYMDGLWSTDDLTAFLIFGVENRKQLSVDTTWLAKPTRLVNRLRHRRNRNTKGGSRKNIHAHYDLGNDMYRTFLDETMTYSCAYFDRPDEPLADAQRAKYRRICEKLALSPGDHVLEIGGGWGGFGMFAAEQYGCRVTMVTISTEQLELARERIAAAGLSDRVEVQFCDYRDIVDQYDKIVSIEMLEAVGAEYFETFFQVCDRALRTDGRMCVQVITVPDRHFAGLRDGVNWIQKYIFPGGMLPSLSAIEQALKKTDLLVTGAEDIGPHYPPTLRRWRETFLANSDEVRAQGFDDRFVRMWEYYLCASEAAFLTDTTGDLQIVFEKVGARHDAPQLAPSETATAF